MSKFWGQKSFLVITGASQGLGRGFALEFAKKLAPGSVLLLVARNGPKLEETKTLVEQSSPHVEVQLAVLDLSELNTEKYRSSIQDALASSKGRTAGSFEHSILVHNAGHIGDLNKRFSEQVDEAQLQTYFNLNLISVILLNSAFLNVFSDPGKQRTVIQISSSASVTAMPYMGTYCVGKAARNHFIRMVAVEEENVRALSYAPGLIETDMYQTGDKSEVAKVREFFGHMRELGNVKETGEGMYEHLIKVLEDGEFENGAFIDYYEKVENYHPDLKAVE